MAEAHVDALFHLGAMAVVFCIGYLGVDKVRSEPDAFFKMLGSAQEKANELLHQLDAIRDGKIIRHMNCCEVRIYCHIAQREIPLGRWYLWHCVWERLFYLPFLGYFRSRRDIKVVGGLGLISLFSYLLFCFDTMWPGLLGWFSWAVNPVFLFAFYTLIIIWIIVTATATFRLREIDQICDRLWDNVQGRLTDYGELAKRATLHVRAPVSGVQPDEAAPK